MLTWYVIRIMTGRELRARDELQEQGITAIVPVAWRFQKRSHNAQPCAVQHALMPGYLFAGFHNVYPDWYGLPAVVKGWIGPLHIDGDPARISAAAVQRAELLSQPKPSLGVRPERAISLRAKALAELREEVAGIESRADRRSIATGMADALRGAIRRAEADESKRAVPDAA